MKQPRGKFLALLEELKTEHKVVGLKQLKRALRVSARTRQVFLARTQIPS